MFFEGATMKICGLITEYNPFHHGHAHHLKQARALSGADAVVAVMSGHFLQRGEPALLDKWTRAKMAVLNGVDLVVELPTFYATASAEQFAYGSVALLSKMGVDTLCFGSESGDIESLKAIAKIIDQPTADYRKTLEVALADGQGYHAARAQAVVSALGETANFSANNILGIEYLRALNQLGSAIKAHTIQRIGADYLDSAINTAVASATAIRRLFWRKPIDWQTLSQVVPSATYQTIEDAPVYTSLNDFKWLYNAAALRTGTTGLQAIRDCNEGLENRLIDHLSNVLSLDDYVAAVATKRYTKTRIQRLIINALLGIEKTLAASAVDHLDYGRILAFNEQGKQLIKHIKANCDIAMLTNLARDLKKYRKDNPLITLDIKATGIYSQVNHAVHIRSDYQMRPYDHQNQ